MFVEAVYVTLGGGKKPAPAPAPRAGGGSEGTVGVRGLASLLRLLDRLAQGRQGGAPPTARAAAPIDLTGTWVSVVTEDWRWRMRTPPKGDYASVPLNDAATKAADAWDPAKDTAAGEQCRGYGAAAIMRMPGRIRIAGTTTPR